MRLTFAEDMNNQSRGGALCDVLAEHPSASVTALGILCEAYVTGSRLDDLLPALDDADVHTLAALATEAMQYR